MRFILSGLCGLALLATGTPVLAQVQLNADQIRSAIVGNTITMVTERMDEAMGLIEADGSMRGMISGERFEGTWSIDEENTICFDLPGQKFDICRRVIKNNNTVVFFALSGTPRGKVEVLQGNPNNF